MLYCENATERQYISDSERTDQRSQAGSALNRRVEQISSEVFEYLTDEAIQTDCQFDSNELEYERLNKSAQLNCARAKNQSA